MVMNGVPKYHLVHKLVLGHNLSTSGEFKCTNIDTWRLNASGLVMDDVFDKKKMHSVQKKHYEEHLHEHFV